MMVTRDIPEQLKRLEIPGRMTFLEGNGELTKMEVHSDWSRGEIYLHGAHLTDFRKQGEPPLLFTSTCSRFKDGQPIRGGVPIIFPWFGAREGEPMHGFARISEWQIHEAAAVPSGGVSLRLSLPETAESGIWPSFTANYVVTITDALQLELIVTNTSPEADFSFENCLHTYFAVGDVRMVRIVGLKGEDYLDKVDNFARKTEKEEAVRIAAEVDRIYLDTVAPVEIHDEKLRRRIRVEKFGSQSTVVWNPWHVKGQQMPDLGMDEYLRMVCVESGNVAGNKLTLHPGQSAVLGVKITSQMLS